MSRQSDLIFLENAAPGPKVKGLETPTRVYQS